MKLENMNKDELLALKAAAEQALADFKSRGLQLNMARGKPCTEQTDLSNGLQTTMTEFKDENGADVRNYGNLEGIPELRRLFGQILGVDPELVLVGGASSLNLMFDTVSHSFVHGVLEGMTPWYKLDQVKFLCPSPGYDRHFAVSDNFYIENVTVPMQADGPDMDVVERLVSSDPAVKGIWVVPKYSNPTGITFSDEVVRRFAALEPAAEDFRIYWDNAYAVHDLYTEEEGRDHLLNLYDELKKNGKEDMAYFFASTSKVTIAASGVGAMAMSPRNFEWARKNMSVQAIGFNRVNQLRHAHFIPDMQALDELMMRHAAIIRPKFQLVLSRLSEEIAPLDCCSWSEPRGGYFISFNGPAGTAKRIVALCKEAGVVLTGAGATYPYGKDPADSNIRIAPTFPPLEELAQAMEVFCWSVKLAAAEKYLG
ncbi:MAG: aminotransferase [Firmicutes bacterium]|nr:aminotransferase [Bacillota bacterium]